MAKFITRDIELSDVQVSELPELLDVLSDLTLFTQEPYTVFVRGIFVSRKGETFDFSQEYKAISPIEYSATQRKRFYTLQDNAISHPVRPLSDRFSFVRISFHAQEPSEEEYKRIAQGERATEEHIANCR